MPLKGMRLVATLAATAALTVAACGGSDEETPASPSGASTGESKPVTLKVGVLPIGDLAPLYLGMDQGFFKEENLTIEPAVAEGGAAVVPAVMSGDNQIGFSNVTSIMNAVAQNLPLKPIAAGVNGAATEEEAWDALLAPKGGVTDLKQLEGKKVSVNTLKNLPEVAVRNSLEKAGVDVSKVEFVEIPFPDVPAALEAKRVDAAFAVEPFVGASVAAGATKLAEPFEELAPNLTIAEYFTTEQYASENADVVERFTRAMNKSLDFAQSNPDEVRRIITTYTKTPQEAADKMALPTWSAEVNGDAMATLVEASKKYGVLKGDVDVDRFVNLGS
ncbi:ABC transporter substrate-binding protein [Solirubrobacter phytolaccae]|uniref:ABC transporter substrate-binding protein n=1 Tax=Solirubrobacter phytolaccae TaxID=1404360 RepID=A0A9X3S933_9ACTN|nr:ABC transporter substrate-binding protein [Solirubrobacter phytolaccae]MDA0182914.1 ABC transporter substrate-binding protein [Solirubrobacter phytolaccae]